MIFGFIRNAGAQDFMRRLSGPTRGRNAAAFAALLLVPALVSACSGTPPPPETVVDLTLIATPDLNPDAQGRPSPVHVRIFELTSEDPFRVTTYYDLRDEAEDTLGPTAISMRETVVNPGTSVQRTFEVEDTARVIALAADYQDIETAIWRAYIPIRTGETNRLHGDLRADEVTLILTRPQQEDSWWDTLSPF